MQNPAPGMLDHKPAVQHPEAYGRYCEEVERHDGLAVIVQEGQPAFPGITAPLDRPEIPRNRSFGEQQTKFEKLAVVLGSAPGGILPCHPLDQFPEFESDLGPAAGVSARPPAPIQPESGAMPPAQRLRLDN